MLTLRRFKITAIFTALAILLIGAVVGYADTAGGYITSPSLYWSISIYDVGFTGRNSHSGHSYAIENYSQHRLSVTWEYSHKVMRPDNTLYEDDSIHDTIIIGKQGERHKASDAYGRGERGVSVVPGMYYLDTYTSIDILYVTPPSGTSTRIKYKKLPIVTDVTTIN